MTRWLQAAKQAGGPVTKPTKPTELAHSAPVPGVLSVKSVLSGGDSGAADMPLPSTAEFSAPIKAVPHVAQVAHIARPQAQKLEIAFCASDPKTLLNLLRCEGPQTYGAAASALGWGASRAWRAEASLKAAGLVSHGAHGRAHPVAAGS